MQSETSTPMNSPNEIFSAALGPETAASDTDYTSLSLEDPDIQELNSVRDFHFSDLGFNDFRDAIGSSPFDDDYSTKEILRVHILRIQLLSLYYMLKQYLEIDKVISDLKEVAGLLSSLVTWSLLLQVDRLMILVGKMYGFIFWGIDSNAIDYIFHLIPRKVPSSVIYVETEIEANIARPPAIPKPYLNSDKKMVYPSEKEIQRARSLQNEHLVHQKLHTLQENLRILNNFAKLVVWGSLIQIQTVQLISRIELVHLKAMILNEFQVQLSRMKHDRGIVVGLVPLVSVINGDDEEIFDPLDSLEPEPVPEDSFDTKKMEDDMVNTDNQSLVSISESSEWVDDERRVLKVYVNCPPKTVPVSDLIIIPNTRTTKMQIYPKIVLKSTTIYQTCNPFSFKAFIYSLHHYQKSAT